MVRSSAWCVAAVVMMAWAMARAQDVVEQPYNLENGLVSRSISFENPTGEPGVGGKAESKLGVGRKGAPSRSIKPGETVELCNIQGPGTVRNIWMTFRGDPVGMRSYVIRVYYDGQEHPSIECPAGDFFGCAHGKVMPYDSAVHSVGQKAGMMFWLPMPFTKSMRMTFTNEGPAATPLFYQINYTLGDKHAADVGKLHVLFRRENPTTQKQDFELLPKRGQKGRFIGSIIGIRNMHPGQWWGEGEIKVYMDGDKEFATIVGTGSEDYVGLSWGIQQTPYRYSGCSLNMKNGEKGEEYVSMYRWHLPDPVQWKKEARITIQQIAWKGGLAETSDDWSCATFWYEPTPSAALPAMPDQKARTANIWTDEKKPAGPGM